MARRVTQSTRRLLPRAETHDARRLLGAAVRRAEGGLLPPVCLLPLGLRQLRRGGGGAARPSLFQTCPRLRESSVHLLPDQRGRPAIASELMRPPITFICSEEAYPAMTPNISESPHPHHQPPSCFGRRS